MSLQLGTEVKLDNPPSDGISSVRFSSISSDFLLVSSWDRTIRLYNAAQNAHRGSWFNPAAVLDCAIQDDHTGFCGGLDRTVRMLPLSRPGEAFSLGTHTQPISCMDFARGLTSLLSGSWDGYVHFWDPRKPGHASSSLTTGAKVYTLTTSGNRIVIGTSDRSVLIYDVRNLSQPEDRRESSLKHQTRCIRISPDNAGYVLASVEGRVAVEYFDNSPEVQTKRYAFKCHRSGDRIYPVNAIAFHPIHGTFATGGCDGNVFTWDGENKKRVGQFAGLIHI